MGEFIIFSVLFILVSVTAILWIFASFLMGMFIDWIKKLIKRYKEKQDKYNKGNNSV